MTMMNNTSVARIAWRLALCGLVSWCVWRVGGLVPMVCTAPLYGVLLAKPLLDLMSDLRHQTRVLIWRPLEGRYYVYRGTPVQVIEDDAHVRWVRAADVCRIVGFTASDGALALAYPNGWRLIGEPAEPHFSDAALIAHLRKERSAEAGRFTQWAERTIAYPARQLRARDSN
jgi:hypothetical protein